MTTHRHDAGGLRVEERDALGVVTEVAWDALGRPTETRYSDGTEPRANRYDEGPFGIDRRSSASNDFVTVQFAYTRSGQLAERLEELEVPFRTRFEGPRGVKGPRGVRSHFASASCRAGFWRRCSKVFRAATVSLDPSCGTAALPQPARTRRNRWNR